MRTATATDVAALFSAHAEAVYAVVVGAVRQYERMGPMGTDFTINKKDVRERMLGRLDQAMGRNKRIVVSDWADVFELLDGLLRSASGKAAVRRGWQRAGFNELLSKLVLRGTQHVVRQKAARCCVPNAPMMRARDVAMRVAARVSTPVPAQRCAPSRHLICSLPLGSHARAAAAAAVRRHRPAGSARHRGLLARTRSHHHPVA